MFFYQRLEKIKEKNLEIVYYIIKKIKKGDLWGPLILCLMLALTLSIRSNSE